MQNEWQTEKEQLERSRPKQRGYRALNTVIAIVLLVAVAFGIYFFRRQLGEMWLRVTGKAPAQVEEAEPDDGPLMPGKDF